MAGGKSDKCKGSGPDYATIAKKIVIHSKADPLGDKYLKYLRHVLNLKKSPCSGRFKSPWMELRTEGAFTGIMGALKRTFTCDQIKTLSSSVGVPGSISKQSGDQNQGLARAKDICNVSLSVLSNAFALDYIVRAEAVKNGFTASLQQFIFNFTQDFDTIFKNAELLSRAIKCTANLSNDSQCREAVLKTGVAISILKILELADEKIPLKSNDIEAEDSFIDKSVNAQLICSCVRAVRILASDPKCTPGGKDHLIRFGAPVAVINVLTWEAKLSSNEDLMLDVIRALTLLSIKIRGAPSDVVQKLIYNPEVSKIRNLLRIFESSQPEGKLYTPVINCLINLSANKEISDCLGGLRVFHIILNKLESLEESSFPDLIRLLVALTKYSSFNQSHLTTSSLIGSTLKILKSTRFKEFHDWLLRVYENLYEVSLSKLIKCGLVNHLCEILREELENCDYDSLRKKISTLDDGRCSVHQNGGPCPFAPVYRCSSPSYQKIQEDMKFATLMSEDNINMELQRKREDDSLSPCSSPAHSWTSGSSSPIYLRTNLGYSSVSEDEGCFSPSSSSSSPVGKRSRCDSPESDLSLEKQELNNIHSSAFSDCEGDSDEQEPALKKLKLEDGSSSSSFSDTGPTKGFKCSKSLEVLKASVKKIVAVLNILYKCTYINPFPESILQITPILVGIIVRGKISVMPQRVEYQTTQTDDEFRDLSRRSFEVSYKILLQMSSIYNIFPGIIVSGIIPILNRLEEPIITNNNSEMDEQVGIVQRYCTNLLTRMVGLENDTAGWREGFIMRTLLVNNSSITDEKMDQMVLNIPLLYEKHPSTLRKFEMKAKSWTKILDMLLNSDESSFYRFEDCALALCSICRALGVKWKAYGLGRDLPLLFNVAPQLLLEAGIVRIFSKDDTNDYVQDETTVQLVLDDGSVLFVNKELLVFASPVFLAMFNGHFVEAGEQKVHLPNISRNAVCLLINQIYMLNNNLSDNSGIALQQNECELATIFELFSLADRFLLEDIYEMALNTLITKYICPYSAPMIYAESVKLASLQKFGSKKKMMGDSNLNMFILEYILTAEGIRMSERCNAIRKTFDAVMPEHVVQDLKALIENYMYKFS